MVPTKRIYSDYLSDYFRIEKSKFIEGSTIGLEWYKELAHVVGLSGYEHKEKQNLFQALLLHRQARAKQSYFSEGSTITSEGLRALVKAYDESFREKVLLAKELEGLEEEHIYMDGQNREYVKALINVIKKNYELYDKIESNRTLVRFIEQYEKDIIDGGKENLEEFSFAAEDYWNRAYKRPTLSFYTDIFYFIDIANPIEEEVDEEGDDEDSFTAIIDSRVTTMSILDLKRARQGRYLELAPKWQRKVVWGLAKQKKLIESILEGIPTPTIILGLNAESVSIVVDGRQRLTSMFSFIDDKVPVSLPSDHRLFHLNKKYFSQLPRDVQLSILDYEFPVVEIKTGKKGEREDEKILRRVFQLYNVSGAKLNASEVRNAVYYRNKVHKMLYVLTENPNPKGSNEPKNLYLESFTDQKNFRNHLLKVVGSEGRFKLLNFLERYVGYTRLKPGNESFLSTSRSIDAYYDNVSERDGKKVKDLARDIVDIFKYTETLFYHDQNDFFAFCLKKEGSKPRFNELVAVTNMACSRILKPLEESERLSRGQLESAIEQVLGKNESEYHVDLPQGQDSKTIWGYQAKVIFEILKCALDITDPEDVCGECKKYLPTDVYDFLYNLIFPLKKYERHLEQS